MIGWVQAYGPALDNLDPGDILNHVLQIAADFGFHEGISFEESRESADSRVLQNCYSAAR